MSVPTPVPSFFGVLTATCTASHIDAAVSPMICALAQTPTSTVAKLLDPTRGINELETTP